MLKTVFLTASRGDEGKNFEHIMRIIFLSRYSDLTMLVTSRADFERYLSDGARTVRSPFPGKLGLIVFSFHWLLKNRKNLDNVILVSEPSILGVTGLLGKLVANIKWVVDVWDIPIRHQKYVINRHRFTELRVTLTRYLMRLAYKKADLFIVGIRPDFQFRYYQVPESKTLTWQTTIWIPDQRKDNLVEEDGYFNILCMRSLHTPACGLDILLKAFLNVRKQIDNTRLWVIGRIREDVEHTIKGFRDLEGVEFRGFLEHREVMQLIRQAHLCVIPWYDDVDLAQAYPTKVMEYMTEGKVVLAARIAAISDMIRDGEDGLLHRPGDPDDLADKIVALYKDGALRERLADNARRYHPRFDTICKHEEIFRVLKSLVNDRSPVDVNTIDKQWLS
ncbi:MAG TPA: glycosyltransferase [Syntrophorhabdales bacterium]|nr:glycosyltransferase [Syntrophorhabdales bacterium]